MNEQQSIFIAAEYIKQRTGKTLELIAASYHDGLQEQSMFYGYPTWEIWFSPIDSIGIVPGEIIVYVDVTKSEAWEMSMGSEPVLSQDDE